MGENVKLSNTHVIGVSVGDVKGIEVDNVFYEGSKSIDPRATTNSK